MVKIHTPAQVVDRTVAQARVHDRYGVTVVAVKSPGRELQYGSKDIVMHRNDELIIMGKQDQIDHFMRGLIRRMSVPPRDLASRRRFGMLLVISAWIPGRGAPHSPVSGRHGACRIRTDALAEGRR